MDPEHRIRRRHIGVVKKHERLDQFADVRWTYQALDRAVLTPVHQANNPARRDRCVGRKAVCKFSA
jgi:hypothetical protein